MKTFIFTLFSLFVIVLTSNAQLLYGTTSEGGQFGKGTICTYNPATQSLNTVKSFYSTDGSFPYGSLILADNGKLYGTTMRGGANGFGSIFSYAAATGTYTPLANFDGANGVNPQGNLLQAKDGKLYGTAGAIFSFDPATSTITRLHDLNSSNGSLVQATDGKLYGMTSEGGKVIDSNAEEYTTGGTIFSYDPSTSIYTELHDFDGTNGEQPYGGLIQATDGKLYGMTFKGGSYNYGVIFSFDPKTSAYTKLFEFNETQGALPLGDLLQAADGKLYGEASVAGDGGGGVIFSYDLSTSTYAKLYEFEQRGTGGYSPTDNLIQAADGKLYAMTSKGGVNDRGTIFSYDPHTAVFANLLDFDDASGAWPYGNSLVQAKDGKLYATTPNGGNAGLGVLFSYSPTTGTYSKLKDFGINSEGNTPYSGLCKARDGNLYGTTRLGGSYDKGVFFSYNPATGAFTKLIDFDGTNGANPEGSLIQVSDGKLYGMTSWGGVNNFGTIFSYDPSASTFTKVYELDKATGYYPAGSLMQASNGKLYGTTIYGGNNLIGAIFSFDPATATYTKLYDFDRATSGAFPTGSLVQAADGKLYGMTQNGGTIDDGVIFSYDPSTSTFVNLYEFDKTNGAHPYGCLMKASDGKLYGMTYQGGSDGRGVIFSFTPSTSTYTRLHDFIPQTGTHPYGTLIQASDGNLYGTTSSGGTGYGVVFSYDIAADTGNYKKLADFTGSNGANPLYTSFVEVSSCTPKTYYRDADGDGYGNLDITIKSCTTTKGYVSDSTDCNDEDSTIHPNAVELCDGKDNNCDGLVDENCPVVKLSIGDAISFEGNSEYKKMHFKVSLGTAAYDTIQVRYSTEKGTATPSEDYVPTRGTLTFMPGEKEQTITVLIKGDQKVELPELFKVQLSKPVNATISKGECIGIIIDDDLNINGSPIANGNISTDHSIIVAPNPANSVVNVQLKGFMGNTALQLLSPQGRLLKEIKLQLKSRSNQQLNVSDLSSGAYIIRGIDEQGHQQTVKLIIAR